MTIAAIRFNNPGDVSLPIRGWTGPGEIVGLRGQPGYAKFPTMQIGFEAFQQRIRSYIDEGRNTIRRIGAVYATDPDWPRDVSRLSHIPIGAFLDADDAEQMRELAAAIIRQETGMSLAHLNVLAGA